MGRAAMMLRLFLVTFIAAAGFAGAAAQEAQSIDMETHPRDVQKSLQRAIAECNSGGCELDILVELGRGRMRTVFSDRVRDYEILPGRGARTIRFELHGAYCGGHGAPSCFKSHVISARPFRFDLPH
jgi:hypothetical protein